MTIENIGRTIREGRLLKGLTQEELAARVGVDKARISKIERGKGTSIQMAAKVLNELGLSAPALLRQEQLVDKHIIGYVVAAISEFAKAHDLTLREAANYLTRFKGIHFLTEHYHREHLLPFDMSVRHLALVCAGNGGEIA